MPRRRSGDGGSSQQSHLRYFCDRTEGVEVRHPILILDHHLAIDQGRFAGQPGAGVDHPAIGRSPVIAVPGESADMAAVDDDQGAIAIVLDLVNPTVPGRRLRDEGREFRLDEAERGHIRLYVAGAPAIGKMSKKQPPRLSLTARSHADGKRRAGDLYRSGKSKESGG
jgi:hypothetical protein